jgi:hypothetical protein
VRVGLDSEHAGVFIADRVNRASERAADQAPNHGTANAALPLAGSDDRNAMRSKHGIKRVVLGSEHVMSPVLGWGLVHFVD